MSPIIIFSLSQKLFFPFCFDLHCPACRAWLHHRIQPMHFRSYFCKKIVVLGTKENITFEHFFHTFAETEFIAKPAVWKISSTITLDLIYSRNGNRVLATLPWFLGKLTVIFLAIPLPRCSTSSHMKNALISFQTPVLRNVYGNCSTWNYSMCLKGEQRSVLVNCRFLSTLSVYG